MKIALAQLNFHIGNFDGNTRMILNAISGARASGADLVVFPELAVGGYPPRDFLEFDDFILQCRQALEKIAAEAGGTGVIIGAPTRNPNPRGKPLFNSACLLYEGNIREIRHKSLLPTYDIFDEYRYFEPNRVFETVFFKGYRLALTICEDLWMEGTYPLYTLNPMEAYAGQQPDLVINIAASPFHRHQAKARLEVLKANVERYSIPLVYVNHVGAQTELIFDGGSTALNASGEVVLSMKYFEEDTGYVIFNGDLQGCPGTQDAPHAEPSGDNTGLIHDALVCGIRDYFRKLGFTRAVLGLSGGIDSALVMVLAARALGPENVLGVLMPSPFSSEHSVSDAIRLAENLGCPFDILPIGEAYESMNATLEPVFRDLPFDITEENIQARLRAIILMALANKLGYILLNTSNKSEAAVGYGTLYGDMCGAISVLGDLYKTQVYELARFINRGTEIIPQNILDKPPSAELRPGQKDSDSLPEYDILDPILYQYIEMRRGPLELISMGFDEATVRRILKMVNRSEHKRYQTPPVLRVSSKAFGMGRRMPIVGKYLG